MEQAANIGGRRVLVIEDDRSVARVLSFPLREAGFEVAHTASGGEALYILEQERMAAVVLDLGLPDGQGGKVLQWLHQYGQPREGGPAWVVISALDRQEAARQYGPIGSNFLAKPFDPWQLVRTLDAPLTGKS